jgi:signal transduction histidine kinase
MLRISSKALCVDNLDPVFSLLRHELGNPVNSLKVTLEVLIRNYDHLDDAKRLDFLKRAHEQVTRQQRFLDAMKTYSRIRIDDVEPVLFTPIWNSFLHTLRLKMIEHGIYLIHNAPEEPIWITAESTALAQALELVSDNAIDAVQTVSSPAFEIRINPNGHYLGIYIIDNGCGLKEEVLQKIFTPMFTTKEGRLGLGLSIAQRIIGKMQGWIDIASEPGRGTEVSVWIKMAEKPEDL